MSNILAIDPGIKTGWAIYCEGIYRTGLVDFSSMRRKSAGDAYASMLEYFKHGCIIRKINTIVIETPTPRSMKSAAIQYGMYAIPQLLAAMENIGYTVVFPNEVKRYVKSKLQSCYFTDIILEDIANLADGNKNKTNSIAYFYQNNKKFPKDDNEADAFCLLKYYMDKMEQ